MTICGRAVYHKTFGRGIISACEDTAVTVVFTLPDDSNQVKKFIFPDAFTKKFLTYTDSGIDEYIQKYMKERTCDVCGKDNVQMSEVDGKRLCNSCFEKRTKNCSYCNQNHLEDNFSSVTISEYPYYTSMCRECFSQLFYKCDSCHSSFISKALILSYRGKTYCKGCYDRMIRRCDICSEEYFVDQGKGIYKDDEYFNLCPKCVEEKTFLCSECRCLAFKEDLVDSKYIPAEKHICSSCVEHCSSCGEAVDSDHSHTYFWKTYCSECVSTKKAKCPVCCKEFIQDEEDQHLCPDCLNATEYMELTQKIDFSSGQAKVMNVSSLDYMDRCKLFTNLYDNCHSLEIGQPSLNQEETFHYLIMTLYTHAMILTYLPWRIASKIQYSENVTMTELRSKKGQHKVCTAINRWLSKSDHVLSISEGNVRLLHYPVLVRAQTAHDKNYGKQWDGPYSYIEIGNYGDTTNFYIIGVLTDNK